MNTIYIMKYATIKNWRIHENFLQAKIEKL